MRVAQVAGSFVLGAVAAGGVGAFVRRVPEARVVQPIAFNHALHVDGGISCARCHPGAREGIRAGLPSMAVCLECHEEALTENPEEAKVLAYRDRRGEVPWTPLAWVGESNVFFSHRRHAGAAAISCERCHGPVEKTSKPPETSIHDWSMALCLDCHRREEASRDCLSCHR